MVPTLTDLQKTFGVPEFPHALFYQFEHSLRFELGGTDFGMSRPIPRFMQAHQRAIAVAEAFFEISSELHVVLASLNETSPAKKRFKFLKLCGLKRGEFTYLGKTLQDPAYYDLDNGVIYRHWDSAKITDKSMVAELLWHAISREMPIEPRFRIAVDTYIVDFKNGLVLHVYDDRGMDLVSMKKRHAKAIYNQFHDWLLDYDLELMTETFGKKKRKPTI